MLRSSEPRDYFVCTLGQATILSTNGGGHPFLSLNHLLDDQGENYPNVPVLGMPLPAEGQWGCRILTYRSLLHASSVVAHYYASNNLLPNRQANDNGGETTVALLCSSSLDFAVTLFAAMRMGLAVLLIAPQCTPAAVAHLCDATKATHLIHHPAYKDLAGEAHHLLPSSITLVPLAPSHIWTSTLDDKFRPYPTALSPAVESHTTAFIYHTSGTTSGLPKPLPQTHHTMTTLHPCLPGARAVLSTTPLYHGGLADLVRSLTSRAMLWLFPAADVPVTRRNILLAIAACRAQAEHAGDSGKRRHLEIGYLSCVPYIIELLVGDELKSHSGPALDFLRGLDMLGVGGAPLPRNLGDELVSAGVKLVSRYGSTECGFLMSSARDFAQDGEWQYLRNVGNGGWLEFETQEGAQDGEDVAELVVKKGWPCMTKTNRPDGSFATGDLYVKHSSIPDAWKYLGRKDDLLVLVNGKKADPVPLEAALCAHPVLADALVFGAGRAVLGVLVVPRSGTDIAHAENAAVAVVKEANAGAPSHTRIPKEMVVALPEDAVFPRTSKGTVQRPVAYRIYEVNITRAYDAFEKGGADISKKVIHDLDEMVDYLMDAIGAIVGPDATSKQGKRATLQPNTDLFNFGVDSVQAMRIRNRLQAELNLGPRMAELSLNVVYEYPSPRRLARRLFCLAGHGLEDEQDDSPDELSIMLEMVERYGTWIPRSTMGHVNGTSSYHGVLLLTGATGALGAHILNQVLSQTNHSIHEVICLVRAPDDASAYQRILSSLTQRKQPPPGDHRSPVKLGAFAARLGEDNLGLRADTYATIGSRITSIIHAAWAVNFVGSLQSFEADHIRGVHNLIKLALHRANDPASFYFCSSGATVLGIAPAVPIPETIPASPESAAPIGYARSKWVAEHICARAWEGPMQGRVGVLRIGQLCGDTQAGVWNESEGWPLLLRTMDEVGCLPDLEEDVVWLPVDVAATAILEAALAGVKRPSPSLPDQVPVYHIMNPLTTPWSQVLLWAQESGKSFRIVSRQDWISAMQGSDPDVSKNPSRKLLQMWEARYNQLCPPAPEPAFITSELTSLSPTFKEAPLITDDLILRTIVHWKTTGFLRQ